MSRPIPYTLAAALALAGTNAAPAAATTAGACPADRAALAALLKPLKVEHKWDDPEAPTPDARHYKPGALQVFGMTPNDVFVLSRNGKAESVQFRFPVIELKALLPGFQAAYPAAKCAGGEGCGVDPRGPGKPRSGELVLANIEPGSSEFLGATLNCRYRAD
jgi:hypothetical protein